MHLRNFFWLGMLLVSTLSCMKSSRVSKRGIQANSLTMGNQTAECSSGWSITAEPIGGILVGNLQQFETNSYVSFKIEGSGCSYGFRLNGVSSRNFSRTAYTSRFYPVAETEKIEVFSVSVRDAAGNAVGELEIESEPFRVVTAAAPRCELDPEVAYSDSTGSFRVRVTPSDTGTLTSIAPSSQSSGLTVGVSPSLPSGGRSVVANRTYEYTLNTNRVSGRVEFKFQKTVAAGLPAASEAVCGSVEVVSSLCGDTGVQADFLGDGTTQDLRIECATRMIKVTRNTGGATYGFGTLSDISNIKQLMAGNISGDSKADLLIYKTETVAGVTQAFFQLGVTSSTNDFGASVNNRCSSVWNVAGKALPEQFRFTARSGNAPAKISALLGADSTALLYESSVQVNSDGSCNLSTPSIATGSVSLTADRTLLPFGQSASITWGAVNVGSSACSLRKKLASQSDASYQDVPGEGNKNGGGQQVLEHSVSSGPITANTDFQAVCKPNAGQVGLDQTQTIRINVTDTSYPLQVMENNEAGSPSISFFHPNIPSRKNIADFDKKTLFVKWDKTGGTSCKLRLLPEGEAELPMVDIASSSGALGRAVDFKRTSEVRIECSGVEPSFKKIVMGGAPQIKEGTSSSVSWSQVSANSAQPAQPFILAASNRGAKIRIKSVAIANDNNATGTLTLDSGCRDKILDPAASAASDKECTLNVTYNSGKAGSQKTANLEVTYQRYDENGVLLNAEYKDYLGTISGKVRGKSGGGGRGGK